MQGENEMKKSIYLVAVLLAPGNVQKQNANLFLEKAALMMKQHRN